MFHKCKITVIKREHNKDLIEAYVKKPEIYKRCTSVEDNQEFIINNGYEMPEGICPYAWADIRPTILAIATGGTFAVMKNENSALASCSDLYRPVIFQIERVD